MEKVMRGEVEEEAAVREESPKGEIVPEKEVDLGLEPPVPEFILDVTNINPLDL
jgi:splicing factor 3A subunit 1